MGSCDACLGLQPYGRPKHYKCRLNGCSCTCAQNSFLEPLDADKIRKPRKPKKAVAKVEKKRPITTKRATTKTRFFADSSAKTIKLNEIPDSIKVRNGRWMSDEQKKWIPILRDDNWKIEEIADLIGFCHSAVIAQLKKRKRSVGGETVVYTKSHEPEGAAS